MGVSVQQVFMCNPRLKARQTSLTELARVVDALATTLGAETRRCGPCERKTAIALRSGMAQVIATPKVTEKVETGIRKLDLD